MLPDTEPEARRVREVYSRRAEHGLDSRYAYWQKPNLFLFQSRERDLLGLLQEAGKLPLSTSDILDVGCGDGSVLRDLERCGAQPARLSGVDLLPERVQKARDRLPGADIREADAQALPFADGSSDLVLGFTLLSSVLDDGVRRRIASEMRRVARPGAVILLYDFWLNPLNRDARPLKRAEVLRLFPGANVRFRATTLAPPITRALAGLPGGWLVCSLLEVIPFLKTHYLAAVRV